MMFDVRMRVEADNIDQAMERIVDHFVGVMNGADPSVDDGIWEAEIKSAEDADG